MIYPLVREMAAAGAQVRVPVAVACRVLGFSEQAYYQWLRSPKSAREIEEAHLIKVLRAGTGCSLMISTISVIRSVSGGSGGCARALAFSQ